jgi:hypothetical protein
MPCFSIFKGGSLIPHSRQLGSLQQIILIYLELLSVGLLTLRVSCLRSQASPIARIAYMTKLEITESIHGRLKSEDNEGMSQSCWHEIDLASYRCQSNLGRQKKIGVKSVWQARPWSIEAWHGKPVPPDRIPTCTASFVRCFAMSRLE